METICLKRKELTCDEIVMYNKATNEYISQLQNIDGVLAQIIKRELDNVYESSDHLYFETTENELNSLLNSKLPETPMKQSGFFAQHGITKELANWLNVDHNIRVTVSELTKLVYENLKNKNLVDIQNKKIFRTDEETALLFGFDMEQVNNSVCPHDVNNFSFLNMQKYISKHIVRH